MTGRSAKALGVGLALALLVLGGCGESGRTAGGQQASGRPPGVSAATAAPTAANRPDPNAPATPQTMADKLAASGIDEAMGFTVTRPMVCNRGSGETDWAFHCPIGLADAERDGRAAALEVMIFDHDVDLAAQDAKIKTAVAQLHGRWSLDDEPDVTLTNNKTGEKLKLQTECHQSRGQANSDAFCLLQASSQVLVFTQVTPAQPSSDSITVGEGSDSFVDTRHAADLATLGAIAVAKAQ
jgi:hypothetical protein